MKGRRVGKRESMKHGTRKRERERERCSGEQGGRG